MYKQKLKSSNRRFDSVLQISKSIFDEYDLCNFCVGRLFAKKLRLSSNELLGKKIRASLNKTHPKNCDICKNIFLNTNDFLARILESAKGYEFSTFVIGAILKPSMVDRDDNIRSKYRLRGIDSIKTDFTRTMGKKFSKKTKKNVNFLSPEITVTIDIKNDTCKVVSKPLLLFGYYTKKIRGIPQKEKSCQNCDGKGCTSCKNHGIISFDSVEGIIAKILYKKFDTEQVKITWIGGEDKSSMVFGKGRPFFAKIINPKKRKIRLNQRLTQKKIQLNNIRIIKNLPKQPISFKTKIEILISTENTISKKTLEQLKTLHKNTLTVSEKPHKQNKKSIYSIKHKKLSPKSFSIKMHVDGGLPIKRFVEGNNVKPNISSILNMKCLCKQFDFHEIQLIK